MTYAESLRRDGLKKGMEMGIEKGIKEGRMQGIEERNHDIALKLIQLGATDDMIVQATELDKMVIKKLRKTCQ